MFWDLKACLLHPLSQYPVDHVMIGCFHLVNFEIEKLRNRLPGNWVNKSCLNVVRITWT